MAARATSRGARGHAASTGGRRAVAIAVVMALAAVAGACSPVLPPDEFGLRARLGAGEVTLTWHEMAGAAAGYDVQVWRRDLPLWVDLPPVAGTSFVYEDVADRTAYQFRVRAAGFDQTPAGNWSAGVHVAYVVPVLPVIRIETDGSAPVASRDDYVGGSVTVDPNGSEFAALTGRMQVKGRGNSTFGLPKKPYKIKLDKKAPLLGMPSEKDWVLLANHLDPSQLRTFAAMEMGRATGLAWSPRLEYVEVVLNGSYQGVYTLIEQVEVSEHRVDIDELGPEDVTAPAVEGGYLLEVDARLEENQEPGFRTAGGVPVVIKDPEPATQAQHNYVHGYVQAFEHALYSPQFTDPETGYRRYLDVDSLVDWYLVQELTRSQDAFFSSTFLHKPRGERLRFGPLWDFDLSLGSEQGVAEGPAEGWRVRRPDIFWLPRLFSDPAFAQQVADRWRELEPAFSELPARLEAQGAALAEAVANDRVPWDRLPADGDDPAWIGDWLATRIAWIDSQLAPEA